MDKINDYNVGYIKKVPNQNNSSSLIDIYIAGNTINGYCYKDYDAFYNKPDEVCYIAECVFDEALYKDYVNDNKEKLIMKCGISTYNSIKQELKYIFELEKYYYKYQKKGIAYTIPYTEFDDEMIDSFVKDVFDNIDWQTSQSYISEIDWTESINQYYKEKFHKEKRRRTLLISIDNYRVDNIKYFEDHEGIDIFKCDILYNNKKIGTFSEDYMCGPSNYNFNNNFDEELARLRKTATSFFNKYSNDDFYDDEDFFIMFLKKLKEANDKLNLDQEIVIDTFYPFDYTIQNTQIDDISPTIIEDGNNKKLVLPNILNFNYNISTDKEDDYEL